MFHSRKWFSNEFTPPRGSVNGTSPGLFFLRQILPFSTPQRPTQNILGCPEAFFFFFPLRTSPDVAQAGFFLKSGPGRGGGGVGSLYQPFRLFCFLSLTLKLLNYPVMFC